MMLPRAEKITVTVEFADGTTGMKQISVGAQLTNDGVRYKCDTDRRAFGYDQDQIVTRHEITWSEIEITGRDEL